MVNRFLNLAIFTAFGTVISVASYGLTNAATPSFDCGKARHNDEIAVCRNDQLAKLDIILSFGFFYLKDNVDRSIALNLARGFLKERKACGSDTSCILDASIKAIANYQNAGAPVQLPNWLAKNRVNGPVKVDNDAIVSNDITTSGDNFFGDSDAAPQLGIGPVNGIITLSASKPKVAEMAELAPTKTEAPPKIEGPAGKWNYSNETDKMRNTMSRFATVRSNNTLNFEFPYSGGTLGSLMVRSKDNQLSIMLLVAKGQFDCNYHRDDKVVVKFDDSGLQDYRCSRASDGSGDVIFIEDEEEFLDHLKKSSRLVIEATFYQAGPRQMEFDVANLKW